MATSAAAATILDRFHPAVAGWFRRAFAGPTQTQARAWSVTAGGGDALVSAPTGSGKTLAAFLAAIDDLVRRGQQAPLPDGVQVLYVSPLKALSNDIEKNLEAPLHGIRDHLFELGLPDVGIRTAVRTGDTTASERALMRKLPPHILVTTPESLFILLSSDSGRTMLAGVRSVIVDELHAVAGSKRGAHLMLSLERLEALCATPPARIGLSATVKPIEAMARYLAGSHTRKVEIIDAGHVRERDLALEVPRSPLDAVMSNEVWGEVYDRLAELVAQHRTTLIFVNQRRIAERVARHLAERVGEAHVTAHHGSLAKEHRFNAEQRLKAGQLKALVATSSLELGIDIGDVDLVCQLGSPRWISAFLQRVGRAGHAIGAIPKGRLFPLTLDDLLEGTALLDAVRRGELDRIRDAGSPLDVLAQQIVAEVGSREWGEDSLYALIRRAAPYHGLPRKDFDDVVHMLAEGYSTRRGRRGAYLHHDAVNQRLRPRRGARLAAVTNAGVIPDQFDSDVVLLPEGHRIGTLNEDFAFESLPGDIFQLGNTSYRIAKVETGKVFVEDARGQPPTLPFWLGEGLGRSDELSFAVSRLTAAIDRQLDNGTVEGGGTGVPSYDCITGTDTASPTDATNDVGRHPCAAVLDIIDAIPGIPAAAKQQLVQYLAVAKAALGALPTLDTIVMERFFDEVGDTHLVIHSPYGSRINKAWGLALRKRFCRQFNFELQASALEDSIVLSLGPTHSFPLEDVRHFLKPATARDVLIQALLDAPMFGTRWRWNASVALAVKRMVGGRRAPPQFQRSDAEDLLTVIFPDQLACAENLAGEREIPDHPLVEQTLRDCLHETMDVDGFLALLERLEAGAVKVICRDIPAPSPLANAILSARPYAFLDDGAAEERRTRAVATQRLADVHSAADLGRLDPAAIERVREEAWPEARDADELHDALIVHGFLTEGEVDRLGASLLAALIERRRALRAAAAGGVCIVAAERLHEFLAAVPGATLQPAIGPLSQLPPPDDALRELVRSRLELLGPVTESALAAPLGIEPVRLQFALLQLEGEGSVMRGQFSAGEEPADLASPPPIEWCERRLLARIHRYTRDRRRAEIQPVPPAALLRFLFRWHGLATSSEDRRREGEAGLLAVVRQLEGFPLPAGAWEGDVLPARLRHYLPSMLDGLCAAGRVAWWRPPPGGTGERRKPAPLRGTPVLLAERTTLSHWQRQNDAAPGEAALSGRARRVLDSLRRHGASFASDLAADTGLMMTELEQGLAELVGLGLAGCDSFAGLRGLIAPASSRRGRRPGHRQAPVDAAGRWTLLRAPRPPADSATALADPAVEHIARVLLSRYGVVFRALLARETDLPPWRELHYVYRRLEARGEIRGGRFVSGFSGEQFALAEAIPALRKAADSEGEELVSLSAADPLNLAGILTPGEKVAALTGNRVLYRNGVPVAARTGGEVRCLEHVDDATAWRFKTALLRRRQVEAGGSLAA